MGPCPGGPGRRPRRTRTGGRHDAGTERGRLHGRRGTPRGAAVRGGAASVRREPGCGLPRPVAGVRVGRARNRGVGGPDRHAIPTRARGEQHHGGATGGAGHGTIVGGRHHPGPLRRRARRVAAGIPQHRPHRLVADPELGGKVAQTPGPGESPDGRLLLRRELAQARLLGPSALRMSAHAARWSVGDDDSANSHMTYARVRPRSNPRSQA